MQETGAILESLSTVDPLLTLVVGIAIGMATMCVVRLWSLAPRKKADPLSGLFARETLDNQLAQIADPDAVSERKDREASAFRAKLFSQRAARSSEKVDVPPHRAERYDHAAVLDHVAKVMRAGKHTPTHTKAKAEETPSDWEEVLLLPAPTQSSSEPGEAKAA